MLVAENIWEKAMDILLCGIDPNIEYKFMSKWNSYANSSIGIVYSFPFKHGMQRNWKDAGI